MAIVKMSEFNLIVQTEDLDKVLREFQLFRDVEFKDITELAKASNGFKVFESDYDFDKNNEKQEHIISILKFIDQFGQQKKGFLEDLNLLDIDFRELEERALAVNLDEILDRYAEFYERHEVIAGYESVIPWENHRLSTDQLEELSKSKIQLGTVLNEDREAFIKDLKTISQSYVLHKQLDDELSLFMILFPESETDAFEILI